MFSPKTKLKMAKKSAESSDEEPEDMQEFGGSKAPKKSNKPISAAHSKLNALKAADSQKRYAFLLGQTDIFKHFINVKKMKNGDKKEFNDFAAEGAAGRARRR